MHKNRHDRDKLSALQTLFLLLSDNSYVMFVIKTKVTNNTKRLKYIVQIWTSFTPDIFTMIMMIRFICGRNISSPLYNSRKRRINLVSNGQQVRFKKNHWNTVCDDGPTLKQHWISVSQPHFLIPDKWTCRRSVRGHPAHDSWICNSMLGQCWASVVKAGTTLTQHRVNYL